MITGKRYRRVVTGYRGGKSVVLSDQQREPYRFKTVPGLEQTYMWSTDGSLELNPDKVERELRKSALPPATGSLLQVVTFPPANAASSAPDPSQIAQEFLARLPGLADTFEPDGSRMHVTQTVDYAILLDGELWLELDDGETVHLSAGDIVVQQATRHGWRNKGDRPATIAFVMLGRGPHDRLQAHDYSQLA
jgi:Cupin domain